MKYNNFSNFTTLPPTEVSATYTRDAIILTILSIIIITVNLLIIIAFYARKKLRRRSANVLIFSQAGSDLFTGIVYVPAYLIERYYQINLTVGFLTCYMLFLSLFNLLALSTDRYLALSKPFLHYRIIDVPRTIKVIISIWLIPLALTLIPLTWWFKPYQATPMNIYLGIVWLFMLVLVIAMTILYSFVTLRARRTIRSKRRSIGQRSESKMALLARKELRVIHLFGLLLFFFAATYLPILYMNLCDIIGQSRLIPAILQTLGFYLLLFNSIVNPVLCIYLKKDYYQQISNMLTCKQARGKQWTFRSSNIDSFVEMETSLLRKNTMKNRKISFTS